MGSLNFECDYELKIYCKRSEEHLKEYKTTQGTLLEVATSTCCIAPFTIHIYEYIRLYICIELYVCMSCSSYIQFYRYLLTTTLCFLSSFGSFLCEKVKQKKLSLG